MSPRMGPLGDLETDESSSGARVEQGTRGDTRVLDYQDTRDDARRNGRGHRYDDVARRNDAECRPRRLSHRNGYLRHTPDPSRLGADPRARIQSVALLGDDRRFDDLRDDAR